MPTSDAAKWVVDHWSELPHLAELPARGPWSSMIGRAGAFLPGLPLDLTAHGWRVVSVDGADQRRIEVHLRSDIDALEDALAGERMAIKTQVAGPWTLAAAIEGSTGRALLQDRGACRDLAQSLAEGIAMHVEQVRRFASEVIVQIDEPSITGIRRGAGATWVSAPRIPDDEEIASAWRSLRERVPGALVLHCCAPQVPIDLASTFDVVSLDGSLDQDQEALGAWLDVGRPIWWGINPTPDRSASVTQVRTALSRLGFRDRVSERISLTPMCGLAGYSPTQAEAVVRNLRDLRAALQEADA